MTNNYLSLIEFRTRLLMEDDGSAAATADEPVIEAFLDAASRFVDNLCGREDGYFNNDDVDASTRYYSGSGSRTLWIDACTSISSVYSSEDGQVSWDSWTVNTDYWKSSGEPSGRDRSPYRLLTVNPNGSYEAWPKPSYEGVDSVKISAVWGAYAAPPEAIKQAVFMLSHQSYMLKEAGGADQDRTLVTAEGVWLPAGGVPKRVRDLLETFRQKVSL